MGKLGSISVQLLLSRSEFTSASDPAYLSYALWAFAGLMALGAITAWAWLPNVQHEPEGTRKPKAHIPPILPSKSLELLAKGRNYAVGDPEINPVTGALVIDDATGLPVGGEGQILSFRLNTVGIFRSMFAMMQRMLPASRLVVDSSDHELPEHDHQHHQG